MGSPVGTSAGVAQFLPKAWIKDDYPEIRCEWPGYGVMRELMLDNGTEFHSDSSEQSCLSLGIEMHYSPRKKPRFKGKIERFFRTYNKGVAHGAPGTCFSNIFDRGDYDPARHAVVTLSTLKKISRLWLADVYHQKPHRALGIPPSQMWNSNFRPEDISLPDDPNQLDVIMGRVGRRVLSHQGIELDGLFYNSPDLHQLRCKHGSRLEVEIRIDEGDIGHIYVLSPKTSEAFKVPAYDPIMRTGSAGGSTKYFSSTTLDTPTWTKVRTAGCKQKRPSHV